LAGSDFANLLALAWIAELDREFAVPAEHSVPPDDRLVNQLIGLERRTARGGRDSIAGIGASFIFMSYI